VETKGLPFLSHSIAPLHNEVYNGVTTEFYWSFFHEIF